ncbi:MAG: hypothetical protein ACK56I_14490, partial [bacterium]
MIGVEALGLGGVAGHHGCVEALFDGRVGRDDGGNEVHEFDEGGLVSGALGALPGGEVGHGDCVHLAEVGLGREHLHGDLHVEEDFWRHEREALRDYRLYRERVRLAALARAHCALQHQVA